MKRHGRVVHVGRQAIGLVLAAALTLWLAGLSPARAQEPKFSFASGSTGATWYFAVGGFLQVIGNQLKGFQVSVAATGGSVENLRQLARKEADFAWAQSPNMYDAWNGVACSRASRRRTFAWSRWSTRASIPSSVRTTARPARWRI